MPARHDDDDMPKPQARDMDPDLEAKRSGPPPSSSRGPKPLAPLDADPAAAPPAPAASEPEAASATIEAKLKDPTFDPEGHERLRLAEESRQHGSGRPYSPTTDVDEPGDPMAPGERNPERKA